MADGGAATGPRILFVTNTRIGDAILTSGVLDAVIAAHPGARVTVACGPAAAPLFAETPGVERVIVMRKRKLAGHWFGLWGQTVGVVWDLIVDMRGSAVARLLPARRTLVRRSVKNDTRHKAVQAADVLGRAGDPPAPRVPVSDATRTRVAATLPPGRRVVVSPAANRPGKTWPADRFADLLARATAPDGPLAGWSVLLVGGPEDRPVTERLAAALPGVVVQDRAGEDLLSTAAALSASDLFIGNDSGLMHLAAAVGTPVLGLFGPTDERLYGPFSPAARVVRAPDQAVAFGRTSRTVSQTETQMGALDVATVLAAVSDMVSALPETGLRPI